MAGTNDILEVAKMIINASIKCNTVRGFIGWHSCDNICMDMHDVLDMCEDALSGKDIRNLLRQIHMCLFRA